MAHDPHIYGEIDNKTNLRDIFMKIRSDVDQAKARAGLTEVYRRAGYLVALSYAPTWEKKFGDEIGEIRNVAKDEFARTARAINRQAEKVGTEADYDETWGELKK